MNHTISALFASHDQLTVTVTEGADYIRIVKNYRHPDCSLYRAYYCHNDGEPIIFSEFHESMMDGKYPEITAGQEKK